MQACPSWPPIQRFVDGDLAGTNLNRANAMFYPLKMTKVIETRNFASRERGSGQDRSKEVEGRKERFARAVEKRRAAAVADNYRTRKHAARQVVAVDPIAKRD